MNEVWKDVVGYEGLYQVSNLGRIKGLDRYLKHSRKGYYLRKGTILKQHLHSKDRYSLYQVTLCDKGIKLKKRPHRLVAEAFIPNPYNKKYVNHIDNNPHNNNVNNLEWCTASENVRHAVLYGHMGASVDEEVVLTLYNYHSLDYIKDYFKTSRPRIKRILKKHNVPIRTKDETFAITHNTYKYDKEICELYKNGYSGLKIAKRLNISDEIVYRCLKRNNIKARTYKQAGLLVKKQLR